MRFVELLDNSRTVGVLEVAPDQKIKNCNEHACSLFGLDKTALLSKTVVELSAPEEKLDVYQRFQQIQSGEISHAYTTKTFINATGQRFVCSLEFWVHTDENNTPIMVEQLVYLLPNGKGDAEIMELKSKFEAMQSIVMSLAQKMPSNNINMITNTDAVNQQNLGQQGGGANIG